MIGFNHEVNTHKQEVDPNFPPIKQKNRKFAHEQNKVINEDIEKLLRNDFIKEAHHPN